MPDGMNTQRPPWGSILAILGAALIWSTSFAVTKVLLGQLPPLTIGAIRFTAAALVLSVLVRLQSGWRPPPRRTVVRMLYAGLLGITAYFGLENVGVDFATAADAAVIVAAFPVITLITEILLGQGRATVSRIAGMLLAMAGVWLIVRQSAESSAPHRLLGDVILLAAGVAWAAYNIAASRSGKGHSPLTNTYYQTLMRRLRLPGPLPPGMAVVADARCGRSGDARLPGDHVLGRGVLPVQPRPAQSPLQYRSQPAQPRARLRADLRRRHQPGTGRVDRGRGLRRGHRGRRPGGGLRPPCPQRKKPHRRRVPGRAPTGRPGTRRRLRPRAARESAYGENSDR